MEHVHQSITEQAENGHITYELLAYVFGYVPEPGGTMALGQIAEDLEETEGTIIATLEELKSDELLDFTHGDGIITITAKDEEFLDLYTVYKIIRR